ncbi:MAG: hypothetical protein L6R41_005213 [Letrouitia leprolyta]|nr:MAG: hypothetical protein L6R41_005213 [Letrouitia leprolyta]
MSIRIVLDNPQSLYTNLDFVAGKAILSLTSNETITAITVKLEGESKTRLLGEAFNPYGGFSGGYRRAREPSTIETEVHKLPFNNSCADSQSTYVNVAGLQVQAPGNTDRHVRKTLPPSLHGFNDQAIIRYYVKATVQRAAFYKENFRSEYAFQFFPIEPPRPPLPPPDQRRETYARIEHAFAPATVPAPNSKVSGLFRKASVPEPTSSTATPLLVCIDARLPDPAILTCNEALPLRIMVTKLNDSPATVFLQLLQIELVAKTHVRAHHLSRANLTSTVVISKSNMKMRLTEQKRVMEIDKGHWRDIPLPNSVAPSFDTCNISRYYELHVKVGLLHGSGDHIFPELVVETLVMHPQVYSGIAPPKALIEAMAGRPTPSTVPNAAVSNPSPSHHPPSAPPFSPSAPPTGFPHQQSAPFQTGQTHPEGPFPDDAPPSYEDAVADGIGPVDGPRGFYFQQQEEGSSGNTSGSAGKS